MAIQGHKDSRACRKASGAGLHGYACIKAYSTCILRIEAAGRSMLSLFNKHKCASPSPTKHDDGMQAHKCTSFRIAGSNHNAQVKAARQCLFAVRFDYAQGTHQGQHSGSALQSQRSHAQSSQQCGCHSGPHRMMYAGPQSHQDDGHCR